MSEIMHKIVYYENLLEIKEIANTKLNLDEVNNGMLCRTCLKDANDDVDLESICVMDVQEGNFLKVRDVLVNLAKGEISDHGHDLPLKICRECLNKIKTFYYFTIQVRKAENVLERLGLKLKQNAIEDSNNANKQDTTTISSQGSGSIADDATNSVKLSDDELMNAVEYLKNYQTPVELCHKNQNFFKEEPEVIISDINEEFCSDSDITQVQNAAKTSKTIQLAGEQLKVDCINETNKHASASKGDDFERQKSTQTFVSNYMEMLDTQCAVCEQNFTIVEKLIKHVKQCHPNARAFKCRNCSKILFLNLVYRHYRILHPTVKLTQERVNYFDNKCAVCQKIFIHRSDFITHCKKHHPKAKAFKCRYCNMHFSHMSSLRRHYRSDHEKTLIRKKHACEICSQSCYSKADLKIHLRIHTGERPYSCPLCVWTFNMKSSLTGHLKTHENSNQWTHSKERPYSCSLCEKVFTTRSNLERHELTHAKRKSKLNLKRKRLYRCSLCERTFRDKPNWEIHEMTHAKRKFIFCKKKLNQGNDANKESYLSVVEKSLTNIGDTENVQCFSENDDLICESVKSLEIEKDSEHSKAGYHKENSFLSKKVEKHEERILESESSLEIDNVGKIISIQSVLNKNNELNLKSKGDNLESYFCANNKDDQSKKSAKIQNNFRDFKIKQSILNANEDSTVHKDCNKNYEPTAVQSHLNKDDSELLEEIEEILLKSKDEEDLDISKDKEDHVNLKNNYETLNKAIVNTIAVTKMKSIQEETRVNPTISVEDNSIGKHSLDKDNLRMDNIEERRTKPKRPRRYRLLPQMDNKCAVCNKIFNTAPLLLKHAKQCHPEAKSLKCRICKADFTQSKCLLQHVRNQHKRFLTGKQKANKILYFDTKCAVCEKIFNTRQNLAQHAKQYHPNAKSLKCRFCELRFSNIRSLYGHFKRKHCYKCEVCLKKFEHFSLLKCHLKRHTRNLVNNKSESNDTLQPDAKKEQTKKPKRLLHPRHRRLLRYIDEKCTICNEIFNTEWRIVQHAKQFHPNAKALKCRYCDNTFSSFATIELHNYKVHKKCPKTNVCEFCSIAFYKPAQLKIHLQSHLKGHIPKETNIGNKDLDNLRTEPSHSTQNTTSLQCCSELFDKIDHRGEEQGNSKNTHNLPKEFISTSTNSLNTVEIENDVIIIEGDLNDANSNANEIDFISHPIPTVRVGSQQNLADIVEDNANSIQFSSKDSTSIKTQGGLKNLKHSEKRNQNNESLLITNVDDEVNINCGDSSNTKVIENEILIIEADIKKGNTNNRDNDRIYKTSCSLTRRIKRKKNKLNDPKTKETDANTENSCTNSLPLKQTKYDCNQCKQVFISQESLHNHIMSSQGFKSHRRLKIKCNICFKYFQNLSEFKVHLEVNSVEKKDHPFVCLVCEKSYKQEQDLTIHNCNEKESLRKKFVQMFNTKKK